MNDEHPPIDPLDRLQDAAEVVVLRAQWEQANRVGLLWIHAILGLTAGTQMILFGSAANIEEVVGLWSRTALGFLGISGGILLALGLLRVPRSITLEAIGLALLGLWDLFMALGMTWARLAAGDFHTRALNVPLPPPGTYVLPYPISVYAGLFALIVVHLWTLRRLKRGRPTP